jgi:hypothetical protein
MISLFLLSLSAAGTVAAADSPPVPSIPDVRIRVVLFPVTSQPSSADGSDTVPAEKLTSMVANVAAVLGSASTLYSVCSYDDAAKRAGTCDPASAAIVVTTAVARSTTANRYDVTFRSIDMLNRRPIGTVTLPAIDFGADAASLKDALHLSPDKIAQLLSVPAVTGNQLTIKQGYQPYLQLVPTLAKADDPSYVPVLANLLGRKGLASVPSQFNAGAVSSSDTSVDALCGAGQRYFVYSVSTEKYELPVSFSTRVQAHATGQLYDCSDFSVTPVGVDEHLNVVTTKSGFTSLIAILAAAIISKTNSWSNTLKVATLTSGFIDTDPDSISVRDHVSERALQGLVDNLCTVLDRRQARAAAQPSAPQTLPTPGLNVALAKAQLANAARLSASAAASASNVAKHAEAAAKPGSKASPGKISQTDALKAKADAVNLQSVSKALAEFSVPESAGSAPLGGTQTSGQGTNGASQTPTTSASTAGSNTLVALSVGSFVTETPVPLVCGGPPLDPGVTPNLSRWKPAAP